jgi:hypothetical protein
MRKNALKKYDFGTATVTGDDFIGKLALPYVAPAVKSPTTIANGFVREIDGLTKSAIVKIFSPGTMVEVDGCSFNDAGGVVDITQSTLTVTEVKVNQQVCRGAIFPTWMAQNMKRNDDLPADFTDFIVSTIVGKVGEEIERDIWKGDSTLSITGFCSADSGATYGGALSTANIEAITTITNANVDDAFATVYDSAVTNCPGILTAPGLGFYISQKTYGLYLQFLTGLGSFAGFNNQLSNQGFDAVTYLGIPVRVCPGSFDNSVILADKENLVYGTNVGTDYTEARVIPVYQFDGSDNVRVTLRFAFGVQCPVPGDVVWGRN